MPDGEKILQEKDRQRLDIIVTKMIQNNEPGENIRFVVNDFKQKYGVAKEPAPTTTKKEFEIPSYFQLPIDSKENVFSQNVKAAQEKLHSVFQNSDKEIKSQLLNERFGDIAKKSAFGPMHDPNRPLEVPNFVVTDEDVAEYKKVMEQDDNKARNILSIKAEKSSPKEKREIEKAVHLLDYAASKTDKDNPEREKKVNKYRHGISLGKYSYDIKKKQLVEPQNIWKSIGTAWRHKEGLFEDYEKFTLLSDDDLIKELNKRKSEYDPDAPVPKPKGTGATIGATVAGQPVAPVLAGIVGSAATAEFGGVGGPIFSAAVGGPQFGAMTYAASLPHHYYRYLDMGLSDKDALARAKTLARNQAIADAASGAVMSFAGSKLGGSPIGKFSLKGSFGAAMKDVLKKSGQFAGESVGEAGTMGGIAALTQRAKNQMATSAGIPTDPEEGTGEMFIGGAGFVLGSKLAHAAVATGGQGISKKNFNALKNGLSKFPKEENEKVFTELAEEGHITKEQSQKAVVDLDKERELNESIDASFPNITEEAREKIKDLRARRDELDKKLEIADDAAKEGLKERREAINKEILEASQDKVKREPLSDDAKVVKKAVDNGDLNDINAMMAQSDPEAFIKDVADQALNKVAGELTSPEDSMRAAIDTYGEELVNYAIKKYPVKQKVTVSTPNIVNVKPKENAISKQSPNEMDVRQSPQDGGTLGETHIKPEESTGTQEVIGKVEGEGELTGITHAQMDETAKEFGLETYREDPETVALWDKQATERIQKSPTAIVDLLNKMRNGEQPDKVEQRMMIQYIADLKAKIRKNPTDELLAELKRAKDLSNIVGGREVAKSLRARQAEVPVEETLPDFLIRDMEAAKVDKLTPEQKAKSTEEFQKWEKAKSEYEAEIQQLKEEAVRARAEAEYSKTRKSPTAKTKRTHDDFAKERQSLVELLKKQREEHLQKMKDQGISQMGGLGGLVLTPEMAKTIGRIVKSFGEEGVEKLADVIKAVHESVKDIFEGITEQDIHAVIAGEYNEKRPTKSELAIKLKDWQDEAKLITKYKALINGEEPKSEKAKIKRNQEITALREKISAFRKEEKEAGKFYGDDKPEELRKLAALESRIETETKKIKDQLAKGEYEKEKKKPILEDPAIIKQFPQRTKAVQEKLNELIKLKQEREIRLMKQEYENRSGYEKARDYTLEVLNVPRTIMSSMDFSALLRQGIVAVTSHPIMASKAAKTMFKQAASQKEFDHWFHEVKESPRYKLSQDSELSIADPHDYRLSAKEEAFMNNLAEKIPFFGKYIKGSERAYVGFLNKMRWDLFNMYVDRFMEKGKTFENSPELYKAIAHHIGDITGRGHIGKAEPYAPVLNSVFFSPRLIASRMNLLTNWANPQFYRKVPKEVRVEYFKDMLKFIATGVTTLAIAKLAGADVETDPRSSDFGKIKYGNTRWDIWGGFQQYVRLIAQIASGEKKSTRSGEIQELDSKGPFGENEGTVLGRFTRGKLAPIPALGLDLLSQKTIQGEPIKMQWSDPEGRAIGLKEELLDRHFLPLIYGDVQEAMKDQGVKALFTVGLPATFGIGVQTYDNKKKPKNNFGGGGSGSGY